MFGQQVGYEYDIQLDKSNKAFRYRSDQFNIQPFGQNNSQPSNVNDVRKTLQWLDSRKTRRTPEFQDKSQLVSDAFGEPNNPPAPAPKLNNQTNQQLPVQTENVTRPLRQNYLEISKQQNGMPYVVGGDVIINTENKDILRIVSVGRKDCVITVNNGTDQQVISLKALQDEKFRRYILSD